MYRFLLCASVMIFAAPSLGAVLGPDFIADYDFFEMGSVPGLPTPYGGLTLEAGSSTTLIIGGDANVAKGLLYEIDVTRTSGHITGFLGTASAIGGVGAYNDGGVVYGPGGVLFTAQIPVNNLGQTKPGSTVEDRVDDLTPLGIGGGSISALNFVPAGFAGAGSMKVVSWSSGNWYDVAYAPDGAGTFDLISATQIDLDPNTGGVQSLPGGPEAFVYVSSANAGFAIDSLLISEWSADNVAAYELDGFSNPILSTRRDFLTGLNGALGAFVDPSTGDFLISTYGDFGVNGVDQVFRVEGFIPSRFELTIDIKPGSFPNSVNLKSKGVLPVAILGTDEFDVNNVNIDSLLFGDALLIDFGGTAVSPLRSGLEDVSGDGLMDLILKFSTRDLVEFGALGLDTVEGLLTGELLDGTPFAGMDSIRLVPPNGSNGNSLQTSAVPEPTTSALALVALCLAIGRRHSR